MAANLLHGNSEVVGSVTSGGTESILMAVKTYRDRAKKMFPQIKCPEMVREEEGRGRGSKEREVLCCFRVSRLFM